MRKVEEEEGDEEAGDVEERSLLTPKARIKRSTLLTVCPFILGKKLFHFVQADSMRYE
jgi:hypothetical protein